MAGAVAAPLAGRVVEDPNGDGDVGDGVGLVGVTVEAWSDGGDGLPTGVDDVLEGSTVTSADGTFLFAALPAGPAWITARSRDARPSAGLVAGVDPTSLWAEQTWGSAGARCDDGAGVTITRLTDGPCFGGRSGDVADGLDLAGAEHVVDVVVGGPAAVAFGFGFGVITRVTDVDEEPDARWAQGSLRQAVANANGRLGADLLRFVPAVPPTGTWWTVPITADLALIDAATDLDGTAWCNGWACPLGSVRDTEPGLLGSGATVGTGPDGVAGTGDEHVQALFAAPELELDGADLWELRHDSPSGRIAHVAFYLEHLRVDGDFSVTEENLVGMRPDGSVPVASFRSGVELDPNVDGAIIRHNYVRVDAAGVARIGGGGDAALIEDNELDAPPGGHTGTFAGIRLLNEALSAANLDVVRLNHVHGQAAAALDVGWYLATYDGLVVEDNTFEDNGWGVVFSDMDPLSTVTFTHNVVRSNGGPGVLVQRGVRNVSVRANAFGGNAGLAIDHDADNNDPAIFGAADGVTPNDGLLVGDDAAGGLDYPVFTLAIVDGATLSVAGYVGLPGYGTGSGTVDLYAAEDDGDNDGPVAEGDVVEVPHGEGRDWIGSCPVAADGTFACVAVVPAAVGLLPGQAVTAAMIASDTSELGPNRLVGSALDRDWDALPDLDEDALGTDPDDPDTDDDGLTDGDEVLVHLTDPLATDTDADGLDDRAELEDHGTDPLLSDTDDDGLDDAAELEAGTGPANPDTDADGLLDGEEVLGGLGDPMVRDTDGDGLDDGEERDLGTDAFAADTDDDGLDDPVELLRGTDPLEPDTDHDGLLDGEELTVWQTAPTVADTDGGGVDDGDEVARGTDPLDPRDDAPAEPEPTGCGCAHGGARGWPAIALALLAGRRRRSRAQSRTIP